MLRLVFLAVFGLLFNQSHGQLKKFYTLKETVSFDTINFSFQATTGNCFIKASDTEDPLIIYGNPDLDKINPSFKSVIVNGTCNVDLSLQEYRSSSLSDGIIFAMVNGSDEGDFWKILFDRVKVYRMDLSYGFGDVDVDLSGTAVKNFKVSSGSADIYVDYEDRRSNKIRMDTFWVKADMGAIIARNLDLTRADHVIADVGFGSALLDFSKSVHQKCFVDASVGAGNLNIFLPKKEVPMIIYLTDSPLCSVLMAEGFEEVERNVFVNMSYKADADNLMIFNVDVAMGNVEFHEEH